MTVFIKAKRPIQVYAELDNGKQYFAFVRHDISLAEIEEKDITEMLNRTCGCCGDYYRCFERLATQEEVDAWRQPIE